MTKIFNLGELKRKINGDRGYGLKHKIAFTNGCFDILHAGHIKYLEAIKNIAGHINCWLVVGINSDYSIKKIKGAKRPIIPQEHRAIVLAALSFVDMVIIFNELTPESLIKEIRPDYLVKGSDWEEEDIIGKDFVESYGGEIIRVSFEIDISTTKIIETIERRYK